MLAKEYAITIHAPTQTVWFCLWNQYHYQQWTQAFCKGSYVITDDWKEGSGVHFLTPDGRGMFSKVTANQAPHKMKFTHLGKISNFKEEPASESTLKWSGAKETYLLTENNGSTHLQVKADVDDSFMDFMDKTFPQALINIKTQAENFYITVQASVTGSLEQVWKKWTSPQDVLQWNAASDDWHTTAAENNLTVGGKFKYRMEAKDGSMGFDFEGVYTQVEPQSLIAYVLGDGRKVNIHFEEKGEEILVTESFHPEHINSFDLQYFGWQQIMNRFKNYASQQQ